MINMIYKDKKDLVLGKPNKYDFEEAEEFIEALIKYNEMIKDFIDSLPQKYKSVIELYNEIKDDYNHFNLGLTCLLYINILENEEILEDYYNNGLKNENKEKFIKYISKVICKKYFSEDLDYDKIYDKNFGFFKIYTSLCAIKEYNKTKSIVDKHNYINDSYDLTDYKMGLHDLQSCFIKKLMIFENKEILSSFINLTNKYDLEIYEQIYLANRLNEFGFIINNNVYFNIDLIIPYMNFIKNIKNKYILYNLCEIKNITPTTFNEFVCNGNLNYDEIGELICTSYRYKQCGLTEIIPLRVLEIFNTTGIHENFELCKSFVRGFIDNEARYIWFRNKELFDIKNTDFLWKIKDRTKEEIKLCIEVLNTITKNIDVDMLNIKFYRTKEIRKIVDINPAFYVNGIGYNENFEYIDPVVVHTRYETENFIQFLKKAKKYNKNYPQSYNESLGYHNINNFKKQYPWIIYQYITKFSNFILNNNIIDNFELFMELLESNENQIESYLSLEIKQMLINEGYLKSEYSHQLCKKYKNC